MASSITSPPEVDFPARLQTAKSVSDHATTFSGIFWILYSMTTLLLSVKYFANLLVLLQSCSSGFDVNLDTSFDASRVSTRSWPK